MWLSVISDIFAQRVFVRSHVGIGAAADLFVVVVGTDVALGRYGPRVIRDPIPHDREWQPVNSERMRDPGTTNAVGTTIGT